MISSIALRNACRFQSGVAGFRAFHTLKPRVLNTAVRTSLGPKNEISKSLVRQAGTGNHTALWTAERALSLGLLGVIPAALAFPSQALDAALAVSIVMHQHWGLEAIVTDYVRPIVVGNIVPKVAHGALLLLSIATLGGLFYFIYNDIGIAKAIRKLWAVKGQ